MALESLKPQRVFKYFEEISGIPHGSGDMKKIADYCELFAKNHSLEYLRDDTDNVIIFKPASKGFENAQPIILQGHLDMVCQKNDDVIKDFLTDGIEPYIDGDFIKAKGTTLGADNGIAVSMILSILESDEYEHPAIEAVFTTDEETGMYGAAALDYSVLKSKRMINLDAEEDDTVTVSCAGGSNLVLKMPLTKENKEGYRVSVTLKGLCGGHSGVEIHKGRINANVLAGRMLIDALSFADADIVSINGGDKANAITKRCDIDFCVQDKNGFVNHIEGVLSDLKYKIQSREPSFEYEIAAFDKAKVSVLSKNNANTLCFSLNTLPDGVQKMSNHIEGLVETSLNMGILTTDSDFITMQYALRSNILSELEYLEKKLLLFAKQMSFEVFTDGKYPPWEYNSNSFLQSLYKRCYKEQTGTKPKVEAIHAGLECGLFSSNIKNLDCIAIGPAMSDVHTTNERLSISSTLNTFNLLLNILKNCK